jgi:hypothetical protein
MHRLVIFSGEGRYHRDDGAGRGCIDNGAYKKIKGDLRT